MKEKILLGILFFLPATNLTAQQHLVDSITKELQTTLPDSVRALSMMRLAIDYEVIDTTKAFKAYRNAIDFASSKKLYYQLGRTHQNLSFLYKTLARHTQAIASLDTAILNYKKSDHPKAMLWEANAYSDKANSLKEDNETQKAIEYYLKSISLLEKLGPQELLVNRYCNLSTTFGDMGEFAKQQEYALKAVTLAKSTKIRQHIFMAYFILAHSFNLRNDSRSAKIYLDSSRLYFNEEENTDNIDIQFSFYLITAQVFRKMNELDSSFYFFQKSFELSKLYNYGFGKAESQLQMGAISILQKKYDKAENYLLAGMEEAKAINYLGMLDDGYKYLSDVYAVTGRYKEAYENFQKYKEASDSVLSLETKKIGKDLETKYETQKKDAQLLIQDAQLDRKTTLNYVLIGSAAVLLVISLLSYRNFYQRRKLQQQQIIELEKSRQLTATEAILKGEEQERTRLAKDLHDGLGGMMSGIKYSLQTMKRNQVMTPENQLAFERSMDMLDSSINEMRRVAHNMMPEALVKFGLDTALKDFCNDINASGALVVSYQSIGLDNVDIDQTTAITVYRIVQELINNTMKHAAAKNAIVQLSKTGDIIAITVEDDGKGFDPVILQGARGIGWNNIQSRISYLRGKSDVQSAPGKGTSVHIEFTI
jgi:two-component system, NarL family, sensor kinase